jgi:hypothetical protein
MILWNGFKSVESVSPLIRCGLPNLGESRRYNPMGCLNNLDSGLCRIFRHWIVPPGFFITMHPRQGWNWSVEVYQKCEKRLKWKTAAVQAWPGVRNHRGKHLFFYRRFYDRRLDAKRLNPLPMPMHYTTSTDNKRIEPTTNAHALHDLHWRPIKGSLDVLADCLLHTNFHVC